ncbi:pentapeptide repeat-containing protein [Hyphomicrobium sp. CS1GBMeth3]|uniref:pentapeptide repeat-containing protein n=1 Tax=Hyphomicrobium sp. CS1GBMeth3 TaxID=1892845 RepID=UPI00093041C9|nr:pentapeptide repeat-containing protein [Hyphomicrobium sp. CS1GBMeth3]
MFGSKQLVPPPTASPGGEVELLLQEANAASASVRGAWILLIAIEAYFFIALSGISHRDLLLNTPVAQPILQVSIPLRSFILFGPLVLIVMHAGVLQQHIILARKLKALDTELRRQEAIPLTHPARLRVHSYYLAQIEAGPETSAILRTAFRAMDWLFLRLLPIGLLLAFQITYLPVHDAGVTWWHRTYVLIDLLLIALAARFITRLDKIYPGTETLATDRVLRRFAAGTIGALVLAFSVAVASIPGEWIDRALGSVEAVAAPVPYQGLGNVTRNLPPGARGRTAFWPTAVLFEGEVDDWTRRATSIYSRNLIVMDEDLVPDRDGSHETSFSLRGRDLNYATFDRSDMHRVDLTDTSMKGASLIETNLEGARLVRVRMQGADLSLARLAGVIAHAVLLDGARLCESETPLDLSTSTNVERVRCVRAGQ